MGQPARFLLWGASALTSTQVQCHELTASAIFDATEARMTGCARVTASHEVPNAALDLEDFNVTLPADFFSARVNTVSFGNTEDERNAFLVNLSSGF